MKPIAGEEQALLDDIEKNTFSTYNKVKGIQREAQKQVALLSDFDTSTARAHERLAANTSQTQEINASSGSHAWMYRCLCVEFTILFILLLIGFV